MMLFPVDTPFGMGAILPMMSKFPFQMLFQTLFWSGLALVLCNATANLIAAVLFKREQDNKAILAALIAGIMLVAWCVFEFIFLPNAAAVFYAVVGIAQTITSAHLLHKQKPSTEQ